MEKIIKNKIYTGIGARKTPKEILKTMENIGEYLAKQNFTLRSGGADGSDIAFEIGANKSLGKKEIYLPNKNFNNSDSKLFNNFTKKHEEIIKYIVGKRYENLQEYVKKLFCRNASQILGENLNKPTDFVICYTENAKLVGGTSIALEIAILNNIKIFNLGREPKAVKKELFEFLKLNYKLKVD